MFRNYGSGREKNEYENGILGGEKNENKIKVKCK